MKYLVFIAAELLRINDEFESDRESKLWGGGAKYIYIYI